MKARRGFALLASLWLMVAISAIALEVSWLARLRRLTTANALEDEQARAAAASGLEHARARLSTTLRAAGNDALADPWRWTVDSISAPLGTARYQVTLRDAATTIDVNDATNQMLAALFAACGADGPEAAVAADRINDWRDGDALRRTHGAERAEYIAAGARILPRDAPVQSVAELDDVLGLPVAAWACVRPHLSADHRTQLNPNTVPVVVLQALPGVSAAAAAALGAVAAGGGRIRDFRSFVAAVPPAHRAAVEAQEDQLQRLLVFQTNTVRVTSTAGIDGSSVHVTAEAMMRRVSGTVFVEWQVLR